MVRITWLVARITFLTPSACTRGKDFPIISSIACRSVCHGMLQSVVVCRGLSASFGTCRGAASGLHDLDPLGRIDRDAGRCHDFAACLGVHFDPDLSVRGRDYALRPSEVTQLRAY